MKKNIKSLPHIVITLSLLLLVISCTSQPLKEQKNQKSFDLPTQFLIDFEGMDLVAVTQVEEVEYRWIILEDGDHVPVKLIQCKMIENIRSQPDWPVGTTRQIVHMDYTSLVGSPISPPPIIGRKFLLWGTSIGDNEDISQLNIVADFWLHPQGLFLIRGNDEGQYIYWNKKSYSLDEIRQNEINESLVPLDQIKDPLKRIEVAKSRLNNEHLGDTSSFVEGLMLNLRNPEEQAQLIEKLIESEPTDGLMNFRNKTSPFQLWYESLFILKKLADNPSYKQSVVNALQPLVSSSDNNIRLTVSIVLAELDNSAGQKILSESLNSEKINLSQEPGGKTSFPNRMKYDYSSVAASAYSLGLLGDDQGLQHQDIEVQLAAADGLATRNLNDQLVQKLKEIAIPLDQEVDQLLASGKLTEPREKRDYRERYPKQWVKVHYLMARLGDNESLKRLINAYQTDISTYPERENPLTRQPTVASWTPSTSGWPSLKMAVYNSDSDPNKLLLRLESLMKDTPEWESPPFLAMRNYLGDVSAIVKEEKRPDSKADIEGRISELLKDSDPKKRAEGLAGAGFNQVEKFYSKVLSTAQEASGIEKRAAIYGLSFYEKEIPQDILMNLSTEGEFDTRLMGVELATRKNPIPFAPVAVELLEEVANTGKDSSDRMIQYRKSQKLTHIARILSRFSGSTIPPSITEALKSPNPEVRMYVVRSLGMGGNPEAVSLIMPLKEDSSPPVREEAEKAIMFIGPKG
jgi:hypothetical protein